ncbi:MAG: class I SAM-dependent methyltransferase [Desulfobacteraceae bacterium]|nr:class I SAM-dependent methyltransferase [Desulfobacteraceae bacterium]
MQDQTASRTAIGAAYIRAVHQILDAKPGILDDPVAARLLGPNTEKQIRADAARHMTAEAKALRSHVVLRSRFAEERLKLSLERGVKHYILVGAGLDTFALRQPDWAAGLTIVEVDHPNTQRLKLDKIGAAGLRVPDNVFFAALDFESQSLEQGLSRHGIEAKDPVFFSWLGVTMYLAEPAIDATLNCMARGPRGSEAVITFRQPVPWRSRLAERVDELGEPFVSLFTPEQFNDKLLQAGFDRVEFLTQDLAARYLLARPDSLPPPKLASIASALL